MRATVVQQPVARGAIRLGGRAIARLAPCDRARAGVADVPQVREIVPPLTVRERLETGFAPCRRGDRSVPGEIYDLFPALRDMPHRRGGDLSGGQQQLAIGRALVTRPRLLVLDEPTEGIPPSIVKDIGRAIAYLRGKGEMAIVLAEQSFEWARDLCDAYAVTDRGQVVEAGPRAAMVEADARTWLSV
ncbi:ABC transporter ATP-binding protein [Methylobacterium oxalidis]|uniref:ABC transporter ATP-binding protein n=1 Tax=Methylobacterium oxalidis TaxID=944322 RepID=A0A512J9G3_9HYPH|nr:ABC transporter ATP-binding protein [Methylobacterium oxalidis]GJE33324.1 High-affinity branched-chain amino acid transport ATP-binding protein LivF [Methylobacterium oxalidis]GLS67241.1 ABC transporter ATP-binding protein [Methylobacterium oxalidis]